MSKAHLAPYINFQAAPATLWSTTTGFSAVSSSSSHRTIAASRSPPALAIASCMRDSMTVARDREEGVFQRLRVTPAPTWRL
jgi:hypothetical protein